MYYKYKIYYKDYENSYHGPIPCDTLDEVEMELENAKKYFEYRYYLVIKHDIKLNMDSTLDSGEIEHNVNKRLVKKH